MDQEKSPFEEIFKREEKRKGKEEEEEQGILNILDKEEGSIFEESTEELSKIAEVEGEANIGEEERYRNLINELLKHHYYGEAISIIKEMTDKLTI
ncbi:hypothetical protein KAX29_06280 [candidate division WOR-3 bacterium]|nr:hypothetical protein [candidate division WOR-3 bacterium]